MPTKKPKTSPVKADKADKATAAKKPVAPKQAAQPKKPKKPKMLDRLIIPGMTTPVIGYDGGIPLWLLSFGLTVQVDRNWYARPGDVIKIVTMPDMAELATKQLQPGDEQSSSYFFTIPQKDLPDGERRLGYVVHLLDDPVPQPSNTLSVLIKTKLPGGPDNDHAEEGHSELKLSLSSLEIYPPVAIRGVTAIVQPYPNMHPQDRIHLMWGGLLIEKPVAAVGEATIIVVDQRQLVDAGDGVDLLVNFYIVDIVGNPSELPSKPIKVLVDLDSSKLDPPALMTEDPEGYIDLERLNGEDLPVELYTRANVGLAGDVYDFTFRAYPPRGGVVVHRAFIEILHAGHAANYCVPYSVVRAAGGGKIEASFVLLRLDDRPDLFSKKTSAQVVGSIVRLQAPFFEKYLDHVVSPVPDSAVVVIPWYDWRKPTDTLTLILRYVKSMNETIVFMDSREVGPSWPSGSPVKRLIYRKQLERFAGYKPQLYFLYQSAQARARAVDLNESLRQVVQIGDPSL